MKIGALAVCFGDESGEVIVEPVDLGKIYTLLEQRLPMPEKKKRWWRKGHLWWVLIGIVLLSFVDFDRGDGITVPDGSELRVVMMPEPDWQSYGLGSMPDYWKVHDLLGNVGLNTLLRIELIRDGLRYEDSGIRVRRESSAIRVDLFHAPVILRGRTDIRFVPLVKPNTDAEIMLFQVIRTHGLVLGSTVYPLEWFIGNDGRGSVSVRGRPNIGPSRLLSNLERAFGLVF